MNMKISPRNRLIIVAVVMVLVLVATVFLLIVPEFTRMGELDGQIAQADNEAASAQTLLAQRRQMKDNSASTEALWLRLAGLVPENPELPSLIIELQDVAYTDGVQLRSITPGVPTTVSGQTYLSVPAALVVYGTWQDTVEFLKSLSKLSRGLRITNVSSDVMADSPDDANPALPSYSVKTSLAIEAYTIPAATASGTVVPAGH